MSAEQQTYSRQEISNESKRKSAAEEIRTANKWVDKKKTPEGKKELSQTWVQKAHLTPAQKQALCDELLVKDIDAEDPKELERRVIALQKHLGFAAKDCDGILGWKTLEKVDQMVENQHKLWDEETGENGEENWYGFDRLANEETKEKDRATRKEKLKTGLASWNTEWLTDADGKTLMLEESNWEKLLKGTGDNSDKYYNIETDTYETEAQRNERIAKQEKENQDEKTERLSKLEKDMNSDDRGVTENITDGEYRLSVQIGKDWEKYLQRDSDGKVLNFTTGEYETMEDRNARIAKSKDPATEEYKTKMAEIADEMKSNPDVYSDTEVGKSTYNFNGEELSLEGEAPNQYITRTVNGKKEMWESESESWEEIKEPAIRIDNLALQENVWVGSSEAKQYFQQGQNVIRYSKDGYALASIKDWKVGDFVATNYASLPSDFIRKNWQVVSQEVEEKYGSLVDWELWTEDLAVKDLRINDLTRWTEHDWQLTIEANDRIKFLQERLQPLVNMHPEMWNLTLHEYNEFTKNPDAMATSRFTEFPGIVYADDFWIENGWYGYDKNDGVIIKRPRSKKEQNDPNKVYVMMDGKFVTARDYISSANTAATGGETRKLPGTEIAYKKDSQGNVELWDMKFLASKNKWEKTAPTPV